MKITDRVVEWAAQECSWQRSGELSVAWMIRGWRYVTDERQWGRTPTVNDIRILGALIEPEKNAEGFRLHGVQVGDDVKMNWREVPMEIDRLIDVTPQLFLGDDDASDWFHQYEDIHPFIDGNGRTGSILYNWVRGSLAEPVHPPNLWNDDRRKYWSYPEPLV